MTILVTGGAGFIGSHMVLELLDAGESVIVLDNLSTGYDWAVPKIAPLIVGDTGDQALVTKLLREHNVEAIIHFAASIVVPEFVRDPLAYYRNNTVNSRVLIECAVNNGVRHFIFSSTAAVYGNPVQIPVREDFADGADLTLWVVEAHERSHVARRKSRAWSAPRSAPVFQRGGRRSALPQRAND